MPFGRQARVSWIDRFTGYSDIVNVGDPPKVTKDLNNVKFRFGRIKGRGGIAKYKSIAVAAAADIIGLFNYKRVSGTHELIRLLRNGVEKESGGSWSSIEGTALTNVGATTQPQFTIIDDTLVFTNGTDRPQKYDGTNNTSAIAAATSPFGKGVVSYLGFLFVFDASLDGTFTDVFEGYRTGYYSDDWDNDWGDCEQKFRVLDETPGAWKAATVIGRDLICLKSDGVVKLTFSPGPNSFQQLLLPVDAGIISPLSLASLGNALAFFLGTDAVVYQITQQGIKPVSYDQLSTLLPNLLSLGKLRFARGMIDPQDDTYYLFYDRTGLANQLLNSYVAYNYRTNEWTKGELGIQINACSDFKTADDATQQLLLATTTLVENLDLLTALTDDGTKITRYTTTNWQPLTEQGWFHGAKLRLAVSPNAVIEVSCAFDFEQEFRYLQEFSLQGGSTTDNELIVDYVIPPVNCEHVNLKIGFKHLKSGASIELKQIGLVTIPTNQVNEVANRGANRTVKS